jgi:hypothetical protein
MVASFKRSLKMLIAVSAGAVIGLAIVVAIVYAYFSWKSGRDSQTRINEERSRKQVLIGEDTLSVKLKLGLPGRSEVTENSIWWIYPTADKKDVAIALQFFSFNDSTLLAVIQLVPGNENWIPKDGLTFTAYTDADVAADKFKKIYGAPCDTVIRDKSVKYVYALERTDEQHVAGKKLFRKSDIVRVLNVSLEQGGKNVLSHGWQATLGEGTSCQAR